MKTKPVRIGNSRGVRIPQRLLEQAGLEEDVELEVVRYGILIRRVHSPRRGWPEAADLLRKRRGHGLLEEPLPTFFDVTVWVW